MTYRMTWPVPTRGTPEFAEAAGKDWQEWRRRSRRHFVGFLVMLAIIASGIYIAAATGEWAGASFILLLTGILGALELYNGLVYGSMVWEAEKLGVAG